MSAPNRIKEYGTTDYDSRRTWDSDLDAGSTPARSTFCGKEGPTKWEDALSLLGREVISKGNVSDFFEMFPLIVIKGVFL